MLDLDFMLHSAGQSLGTLQDQSALVQGLQKTLEGARNALDCHVRNGSCFELLASIFALQH